MDLKFTMKVLIIIFDLLCFLSKLNGREELNQANSSIIYDLQIKWSSDNIRDLLNCIKNRLSYYKMLRTSAFSFRVPDLKTVPSSLEKLKPIKQFFLGKQTPKTSNCFRNLIVIELHFKIFVCLVGFEPGSFVLSCY